MVNEQLKIISQIEHSCHRLGTEVMLNIILGIVAYYLKKQKPRIKVSRRELEMMAPNKWPDLRLAKLLPTIIPKLIATLVLKTIKASKILAFIN